MAKGPATTAAATSSIEMAHDCNSCSTFAPQDATKPIWTAKVNGATMGKSHFNMIKVKAYNDFIHIRRVKAPGFQVLLTEDFMHHSPSKSSHAGSGTHRCRCFSSICGILPNFSQFLASRIPSSRRFTVK
jgi:hypothetical protein